MKKSRGKKDAFAVEREGEKSKKRRTHSDGDDNGKRETGKRKRVVDYCDLEAQEKSNMKKKKKKKPTYEEPLWKQSQDTYEERFVSKATWEQLRSTHSVVAWSNIVWFPQALPRQAFITWLACRNRLDTGDRMRQWGHTQICLLCGEPDETRDHLFFACPFTYTIWTMLMAPFLAGRINPDWSRTIASLRNNRLPKIDTQIVKMTFQASIYWTWRERNGRRYLNPPHSAVYIARSVYREMQNRLIALHHGKGDGVLNEGLNRWNTKTVLP